MNALHKTFLLIGTLILLGILVSGCGGDSDNLVLAEVGPDKIQSSTLNEIFDREIHPFTSFQEEFDYRRTILDSLIIQQLLIQEGYRLGLDASEEVNRLVLANKGEFLLDVLYSREIEDKVHVTDQEVKDMYDSLEYKVQSSHILVKSQEEAQALLDSLGDGAVFEDLAVRYSIDPSAKNNRGDIGYVTWGQLAMPYQETIFNMNPGDISKPFETSFGWHIAKVVDRTPNEERKSFASMKQELEEQVKNIRRAELMKQFLDDLKNSFPVTVDQATLDYLIHKRDNLYPEQILKSMPKNDFDLNQLDRHEKELVLATWDGGQMTLGQYLTMIQQVRPEMKPNLDDYKGVGDFIFQANIMELLKAEARKRKVEDDPEYIRKIKRFKELTMANIIENDSIPAANPLTEEEVQQYYDDNADLFKVPASVHVYEIMVSSEDQAKKYKKEIKSLTKFKEIAGQVTERSGYRSKKGDLGYINSRSYNSFFREVADRAVGEIVGPIKSGNVYSILYLAEKRAEEQREFVQVKGQIYNDLQNQRKHELMDNWVKEKEKEVEIKIFENNLRPGIDKSKYEETN